MLERLKTIECVSLVLAALLVASPYAEAQEVKKEWTAFASGFQKRATEKLVQKDVESRYEAHQKYGAFSWEVRGVTVLANKVVYDYAIKPAKLIRTDWKYSHNGARRMTRRTASSRQ